MKKVFITFLLIVTAISGYADPYDYSPESQEFEPIVELINSDILLWINHEILVNVIKESNSKNSSRTEAEILELDQKWRDGNSEFQNSYLDNNASDFLRDKKEESSGIYAEIFVMDNQGCNVALSDLTSDFWQGDEAKFINSYNSGDGAIFIDEIEFDESSEAYVVQVSLPIIDKSGNVVGAITLGIDMSTL